MKNKIPITKGIALTLCIITIKLSWNIYMNFKDIYLYNIGIQQEKVFLNLILLLVSFISIANLQNLVSKEGV